MHQRQNIAYSRTNRNTEAVSGAVSTAAETARTDEQRGRQELLAVSDARMTTVVAVWSLAVCSVSRDLGKFINVLIRETAIVTRFTDTSPNTHRDAHPSLLSLHPPPLMRHSHHPSLPPSLPPFLCLSFTPSPSSPLLSFPTSPPDTIVLHLSRQCGLYVQHGEGGIVWEGGG